MIQIKVRLILSMAPKLQHNKAAKRRKRIAQGVSPGKMSFLMASPERAEEFSVAPSGLAFRSPWKPRAFALGYCLAPLRGFGGTGDATQFQ